MKDGYKVKICGTTNLEDAHLSAREGADYFGAVIEADFSARSLTVAAAEPLFSAPPLPAVALVFKMPESRLREMIHRLQPFAVQFLSQEDPALIRLLKQDFPDVQLWQSIHLPAAGAEVDLESTKIQVKAYIQAGIDVLLYDTVATIAGKQKFGGTGLVSDWSIVKQLMMEMPTGIPIFLAGGINPQNVAAALAAIDPDGVDLCSGVEASVGQKDPQKVRELIMNVRNF
jgi:phosphoribosylanthranilate isomerase